MSAELEHQERLVVAALLSGALHHTSNPAPNIDTSGQRIEAANTAPEVTWSLFRRVRSYRRAGYLVGLLEFLRRRDACRRCPQATTLPTHPGLYGCGSCSSCTGGPERMLTTHTVCPRGLWPA